MHGNVKEDVLVSRRRNKPIRACAHFRRLDQAPQTLSAYDFRNEVAGGATRRAFFVFCDVFLAFQVQ